MAATVPRLVGVDVARCLALLGMVATHVLDERRPDGGLALGHWLAAGRASALFAVLAGVSLALTTGRQVPVRGRERLARSAGLAVRALLVALLGLVLGEVGSGLAVILTYYGLLFLVGLPFLGLRARSLFLLAAAWAVAAPVGSHLLRPRLPDRQFASPTIAQLADPGQLLSELLLTGYYPVLPWTAYLLVGLALGRLDLRLPRVQASVAGAGVLLAVVAAVSSHVLVRRPGVTAALMSDPPVADADGPALLDRIAAGLFGTTPTGGAWEWLLVAVPHSATPFDLAQTIGSALAVIGGCLLVVGWLGDRQRLAVAVMAGAGTMTLTLYSLHVLLRTPQVWPPDSADAYPAHALVLLFIGAAYVAAGQRGPLERGVGALSDVAARLVRGRPR